ncbi:MAG: amino acid adenylation domain-containing protein [Anaeromyxobacter sp.]
MDRRTLVECLEAGHALAHPDKIAVSAAGGALGWGALVRGACSVAARLREAGIGRGDRVGLWMDKTAACAQALLGVLYAGAAYVPIDPRSPAPRARTIALDCGLAALIVDAARRPALAEFLAGQRPRLVLVDGVGRGEAAALAPGLPCEPLADALACPPAEPARPDPGDLAYVLYTSGSTGTPKGVAHTHASASAFVRWVQDRFQIRSDDVFSSHAPFHFDLSISDLFASLGAGASVRLISPTEGMLAPYLVRMLDPWGITVWYSVPSVLMALLDAGGLEARPPSRLRLLFFAGEVFPTPQLRRLRRALPDVTLVNLFGPTETNVCTYQVVPPVLPEGDDAPIPIGIGCEHMETFVMGDDGAEVTGPGAEGTLWARDGNVMLGYWNDPARTAAMLKPDPRGRPGVACCTGDRVRLRPDGAYTFCGRRDHMVKVRGYRVELGEIEAVLAGHPAVREAVAVPLPDPASGNRIVVSVVARAGAALDAPGLRAHLAARLPNYMVPAGFEVLEELPRTSTGKADRARLRAQWERRGDEDGGRGGAHDGR